VPETTPKVLPADDIEGSPLGPDKVAHALFVIAWAGWSMVWWPAGYGWAVLIPMALGLGWEASNHWFVFHGRRGISLLDLVGFMAGGLVAAGMVWWSR
jgi:hypothetical protein